MEGKSYTNAKIDTSHECPDVDPIKVVVCPKNESYDYKIIGKMILCVVKNSDRKDENHTNRTDGTITRTKDCP